MRQAVCLIIVLVVVLVGCTAEPEDLTENNEDTIFYTEEKLKEVVALAAQAFKYKDEYILLVQQDSDESDKFVKELSKCTKIATGLLNEGHDELADVFDRLGLAGKNFDLWKDTGKAKFYMQAVVYYNNAEQLFNNLK